MLVINIAVIVIGLLLYIFGIRYKKLSLFFSSFIWSWPLIYLMLISTGLDDFSALIFILIFSILLLPVSIIISIISAVKERFGVAFVSFAISYSLLINSVLYTGHNNIITLAVAIIVGCFAVKFSCMYHDIAFITIVVLSGFYLLGAIFKEFMINDFREVSTLNYIFFPLEGIITTAPLWIFGLYFKFKKFIRYGGIRIGDNTGDEANKQTDEQEAINIVKLNQT